MHTNTLPETGFLRIYQIVGQKAITPEQAAKNRQTGKGPKRPRPEIPAILPVSKSHFWDSVRRGIYPKPVRTLGLAITAWRVEDITNLVEKIGRAQS